MCIYTYVYIYVTYNSVYNSAPRRTNIRNNITVLCILCIIHLYIATVILLNTCLLY
jgi:hypothetical protein